MPSHRLQIGAPVPPLKLRTLSGLPWDLAEQRGQCVLLMVYPGWHSEAARLQLRELASLRCQFVERSVQVMAISTDGQERAQAAHDEWQLGALNLGYGLSLDAVSQWGLQLLPGRGCTASGLVEPPLSAQSGMFLIRADGCLHAAAIGDDHRSRPQLREVLQMLDLMQRQESNPLSP